MTHTYFIIIIYLTLKLLLIIILFLKSFSMEGGKLNYELYSPVLNFVFSLSICFPSECATLLEKNTRYHLSLCIP